MSLLKIVLLKKMILSDSVCHLLEEPPREVIHNQRTQVMRQDFPLGCAKSDWPEMQEKAQKE